MYAFFCWFIYNVLCILLVVGVYISPGIHCWLSVCILLVCFLLFIPILYCPSFSDLCSMCCRTNKLRGTCCCASDAAPNIFDYLNCICSFRLILLFSLSLSLTHTLSACHFSQQILFSSLYDFCKLHVSLIRLCLSPVSYLFLFFRISVLFVFVLPQKSNNNNNNNSHLKTSIRQRKRREEKKIGHNLIFISQRTVFGNGKLRSIVFLFLFSWYTYINMRIQNWHLWWWWWPGQNKIRTFTWRHTAGHSTGDNEHYGLRSVSMVLLLFVVRRYVSVVSQKCSLHFFVCACVCNWCDCMSGEAIVYRRYAQASLSNGI